MELLAEAPEPNTPVGATIQDFSRVSLPPKWRIDDHPQNNARAVNGISVVNMNVSEIDDS